MATRYRLIYLSAEHGFEPHAFFDPFVRGWIKQVAESQVQIWVSRAVGMDTVSRYSASYSLTRLLSSSTWPNGGARQARCTDDTVGTVDGTRGRRQTFSVGRRPV